MKVFLFVLVLFFGFQTKAQQSYIAYYQLVNQAEAQFVLKKDSSCFNLFDQAFQSATPYLKDPFVASQIALYLGDTTRFYHYLTRCFELGMPLTSVNASPLLVRSMTKAMKTKLHHLYDQHYREPTIDLQLNEQLCWWCYQSDSLKVNIGGRSTEFHENEDATRQIIRERFLLNGLFPNEHLVGISTNALEQGFFEKNPRPALFDDQLPAGASPPDEFELRRKCPYNLILHSKCFFVENETYFFQAMVNGYLHPKEYAILKETSIIWHKNDQNPNDTCVNPTEICYNIFGRSPLLREQIFTDTEEGLLTVEENRAHIYLQKYSIDLAKREMEQSLGIKFFFDFTNR